MSDLLLIKRHGSLHPMTEADAEIIAGMTAGEVYRMKWSKPRNYKYLQKYFVLLNDVLFELWQPDSVEFRGVACVKNRDLFREQITIAAGHYDIYIGIDGKAKAVAKSISFAALDEVGFDRLYRLTIQYALEKIIKSDKHDYTTIDNWVNEIMSFA